MDARVAVEEVMRDWMDAERVQVRPDAVVARARVSVELVRVEVIGAREVN